MGKFHNVQRASLNSSHPLRIKPMGNSFTDNIINRKLYTGLLQSLPDELIYHICELLSPPDLLCLETTCKFLYAFCRCDELWRSLSINLGEACHAHFIWSTSWRTSLLAHLCPNSFPSTLDLPIIKEVSQSRFKTLPASSPIDCSGVFSDVIYRPFHCANIPVHAYAQNIPSRNNISRIANLTYEEFAKTWSNRPFILTDVIKSWPAFKSWSIDNLLAKHASTIFQAEAVEWTFENYVNYMRNTVDESPLYLFDHEFFEKLNLGDKSCENSRSAADFEPPDCFGTDLFGVLGEHRPQFRWLIIGPARSGSTFHIDPNGTSAWNAVLSGSKYWLMFPPDVLPPGVHVSPDQNDVTTPISLAEYLLNFHQLARNAKGAHETICHAGEMIYVPSGWYHMVINLDECIALTQNFVSPCKLGDVLKFLRQHARQVSGFPASPTDDTLRPFDPYCMFVERLNEKYPEILSSALETLQTQNPLNPSKFTPWSKLSETDSRQTEPFAFSFDGFSE